MHNKAVTEFAEILRGTLFERDHADYEEARKLYNGMIDKRPLQSRDALMWPTSSPP